MYRIYLTYELFCKNFRLEYDRHCKYDYVVIQSGYKSSSQKRICGTNMTSIKTQVSKFNKMSILFHTDGSHTDRGFKAAYKTGKVI